MLLLLQKSLQFRHIQRERFVVADAHGVVQEVAVFAGESGFEFLVCVQGDDVEVDVVHGDGSGAFLYGNLALDLDRFDLQGPGHDVSDGAARAI